jgi:DNA-binding transcriptional regulator YiaG
MESRRENYRYTESGLPNVVIEDAEVLQCPSCGVRAVAIQSMEVLHRVLAMLVIRQPDPLGAHEIRYLRKWLGWSGKDFARHMGVTPETVSRWESLDGGKPMGGTADRLLRMLVARLEPVDAYPTERLTEITDEARPAAKRLINVRARGKAWEPVAA